MATINVTVQSVNFNDLAASQTEGLVVEGIRDYYTKPATDTGYTATSLIAYQFGTSCPIVYGVSETVSQIEDLTRADYDETEINTVEAAVGLNTDGTYIAPVGSNWLDATTDVMGAVTELDTQVGAQVTPVVRTNNPIVGTNSTNANIEALDAGIGTDAQLVSGVLLSVNNSVNQNLEAIDYDSNQKNLIVGLGSFATGSITAATGGGALTIQSRVMGTLGDTLTVQLVDTGGTPGTITWVFPDLVVEVDATVGTGTTDDDVADWINNDATVNKYFYLVSSSSGTMDDMGAAVTLSGSATTTTYPDDAGSTLISSTAILATNRFPTIYNATQILGDCVDILNQRDVHTQDPEHIYKHTLMAVVVYDFAVDGVGSGAFPRTVTLNGGRDLIPDNSVIVRGMQDVITAPNSAGSGGTIKFVLPTDGDLTANITADGATTGLVDVIPVSTAATAIKTTDARGISVVIGTEALTAGKIKLFVEYYVSE